jgi:hypothetical protein
MNHMIEGSRSSASVQPSRAFAGDVNLAKLDLSGTVLFCLSSVDMKTPGHNRYAARRLKDSVTHAKLLLGFGQHLTIRPLDDLKKAVNADYVVRTFHDAAAIILEEATAGQRTKVNIPPVLTVKSG